MRNKKLIIMLLLTGCFTGVWAQETILATGADATGSGGKVSYSVGQIAYENFCGVATKKTLFSQRNFCCIS